MAHAPALSLAPIGVDSDEELDEMQEEVQVDEEMDLMSVDGSVKPVGPLTRQQRRLLENPSLNTSMLSMVGLDPGDENDEGIAPGALFNNEAEREQFLTLTNQRLQIEQQIQIARNAFEELRDERKTFETAYATQREELMFEHRNSVGQYESLIEKIRTLEAEKETLQGTTGKLHVANSDALKVVENKRHESNLIEERLKAQRSRLDELKRQFEDHTNRLAQTAKAGHSGNVPAGSAGTSGALPPGPRSHSIPPGDYTNDDVLRAEQRKMEDESFIRGMTEKIDTIVAQRLSGMMADHTPKGDKSTVNGSSDYDDKYPYRKRSASPWQGANKQPRSNSRLSTSSTVPGSQMGDIILPISRRVTMLPAEVEIYEANPAISKLGLDAMAGRGGQATSVEWSRERTHRLSHGDRSAIPAKKQAVRPKPFTGNIPWKKWYARFCEDMTTNAWNEAQILGSLKEALRDGPGEHALWAFEEHGDNTLQCLVEIAAWICGPLSNADPAIDLETRRQQKGESLRQFGMTLRRLANEAFEGLSPSEPWLVRKLSSLFIDGLEDSTLSSELSTLWKTDMSLNDLFSLADDCTRKRVLLRTRTTASMRRTDEFQPSEGCWTSQEFSDNDISAVAAANAFSGRGRGRVRSRRGTTVVSASESKKESTAGPQTLPDLLTAVRQCVENACGKASEKPRTNPVGKDKRSKTPDGNCFRCKQPGHWARQCKEGRTASLEEEPMDVYEDALSEPPQEN